MLTASSTNYLLMSACAARAVIFQNSKRSCYLPILKHYCFDTGKRSWCCFSVPNSSSSAWAFIV